VHPRGIDAAILERTVEVEIYTGGHQRLRERRQWEILTDYAMDFHVDPELWFDSRRQALDVAVARVTMVDGTVAATPPNGFNELLPDELLDAPAYSAIRRTIVSHIGVEPGARAELDYTVSDRAATPWAAGGSITIEGPLFAAKVHVALRAANGQLRSACVRCLGAVGAEDRPAGTEHVYDFANLLAVNTYELGPESGDSTWVPRFVPRVVYSAATGWAEEVRALSERVREAARTSDAARERALELTRDDATATSRIESLQAFVAGAVDTVQVDLWRLGFAPAAADDVLARSYGSQLDKAVLLLALLEAVDVRGFVVLTSRDSRIAESVPWLGQLDEAWVVARTEGHDLWMPVDRPLVLLRPELPGDCWALRLDEPGAPFQIQPASPDSSSLLVAASLRVSGDGAIAGSLRVTAGGTASPYFELHAANRGGDGILDAPVAQMDLGIESGSVRVVRLGPSGVVVEGRVEGSRAADGEGTIRAVQLPWSPPGGLDRLDIRASRDMPLELSGPILHRVRIEIDLPAGHRASGLPSEVEVQHETGWVVQHVVVEGSHVEITREIGVRRRVVEPADYPVFRRILVASARLGREALIVEAEPGQPAPSRR
jgi:hypothetical protein